ncbi:MAG: glycosyltransferase family 4 protein [candidate division Zixibacteria bacterium]|nr:glycosyltransferase family 4 protein [candidate division Zixibacteria bacterium]
MNKRSTKMRILIVCMWPLGGIRTYLKYNYSHFPKDQFEITLLANSGAEDEALEKDMKALGIHVVWNRPLMKQNVLFLNTLRLLMTGKFDLIHSQGFISALHVSLVRWLFRIPHVLTVHGILEDKFAGSRWARLKWLIVGVLLRSVSVFHGVGRDILDHLQTAFPSLTKGKARWIVINNGIQVERFLTELPQAGQMLREKLKLNDRVMIFGFFGRFMPQKGFNYIIDAVDIVQKAGKQQDDFVVVAQGSGDYEKHYKKDISEKALDRFFRFLPFTPEISVTLKGCDAILMPSIWEAWGLLACEALCAGIPLIATNCIGLREVTKGTPAVTIPSHDATALAQAMLSTLDGTGDPSVRFAAYRKEAAERFDVKSSAEKLMALFRETIG